jgi:hypothetical protein
MRIKMIAALAIAAAAALPLAAIANACGGGGDIPEDHDFVTPSGNIAFSIYSDSSGVNCEIREHTWVRRDMHRHVHRALLPGLPRELRLGVIRMGGNGAHCRVCGQNRQPGFLGCGGPGLSHVA